MDSSRELDGAAIEAEALRKLYARTNDKYGKATIPTNRLVEVTPAEPDDAPLDRVPEWPPPLSADAKPGLVGEILGTLAPRTEADPAALLISLLVMFGSCIGRAAYFAVGAARHYANLFALIVGSTSSGRKGTAEAEAERLFTDVDPEWLTQRLQYGGLVSGEGLIHHVRDPILTPRTKDGHTATETTDPGVTDKRLCVFEGEYAATLSVMTRDGNTLGAVIRSAWDRGNLSTLGKQTPERATDAHVSILAHVSVEELRAKLQTTDMANGFLNRHLLVMARRSQLLPEPVELDPSARAPLIHGLREAVDHARRLNEVRRDAAARDRWRAIYGKLSDDAPPGLLGAVLGRAEAQVARLSLVYALLDRSREIGERHLAAALELWRYCADSARFIFGDRLGDPFADDVARILGGRPAGTTRAELYDALGRNRSREDISAVLRKLAGLGRAWRESVPTAGRYAERWHLTRKGSVPALNAFNALTRTGGVSVPGDAREPEV